MNPLDINLLPLVRRAGQEQSSLPGLYAVNPPRRAARGRSDDQLILYLTSPAVPHGAVNSKRNCSPAPARCTTRQPGP
jgi:hypothetical protein